MADKLCIDLAFNQFKGATQKQVFRNLASHIAAETVVIEEQVFRAFLESERKAPSGTGNGVAIPHIQLYGIFEHMVVFAKLEQAVDFSAVDGRPVDIVAALVSPRANQSEHLRRLAQLSRTMRNDTLLSIARGIDDEDAIYALFENIDHFVQAA